MRMPTAAALLLSGLCLSPVANAGERELVLGSAASADARNERTLEALLSNPSTRDLRVVQLDANSVASDTTSLRLVVGGRDLDARLVKAGRSASGNLTWEGSLPGARRTRSGIDPLNSATLVRSAVGITGTVRSDGRLYRIRPLPSGAHVIIEVDENAMPVDHPEDAYRLLLHRATFDKPSGKGKPCNPRKQDCGGGGGTPVEPGPTETIRVMVVASQQAIAGYGGDLAALSDLAIAESNQGASNSNVGIQFQLAGHYASTYSESGNFSTDLNRFSGTSDGYLDGYHSTRNQIAADVNVLLVDNTSACGIGYLNSSSSSAFSVVSTDCATGYYSFAHEIGHNLGAHHDPAAGNNTVYPYGHGYREPSNNWRTIMAYNCSGGCPRLNYWSNPAVGYGGVPMGTTDTSHNQRVLVERKATVAGFR